MALSSMFYTAFIQNTDINKYDVPLTLEIFIDLLYLVSTISEYYPQSSIRPRSRSYSMVH